ncbi:MAG: OmpA family protein [Actinomyces bowdenii]|nr:OmpA family protein [Actinomyces bowdenii]
MEPVSRQGSVDSAVTYSSNGSTTTASLSGDVNFDVDSATLTDRAKQVLDEIVSGWGGTPPESVAVVGHTDSVADDAHNQTLSEQRAQAVADYLTSKVPSLTVESSGRGESEPVASETKEDGSVSEEGKAANRRLYTSGRLWGAPPARRGGGRLPAWEAADDVSHYSPGPPRGMGGGMGSTRLFPVGTCPYARHGGGSTLGAAAGCRGLLDHGGSR